MVCGVVEGAVGVEGFAGAFFEEDFAVAQQGVHFVASINGDEENFSLIHHATKINRCG